MAIRAPDGANKTLELTYLYLNYLRVLGQKKIDRRFTDNLRSSRGWKCFSLGPSFSGISFAPSPGFPLLPFFLIIFFIFGFIGITNTFIR